MRRLAPRLLIALILVLGALPPVSHRQAAAQDGWVGVPPPADCTGEPLTARMIVAALTEADAQRPDPDAIPLIGIEEADLPAGAPADPADVEAVSAEVWATIACVNGGDFGRFFGHLTPAAIHALFAGLFDALGRPPGPFTAEELTNLETGLEQGLAADPAALIGDERGRIDAIRDVRVLDDGRLLLLADGRIVLDGTGYVILVRGGDGWQIDRLGQLGDVDMLGLGTGQTTPPPTGGDANLGSTPGPSTPRALEGISRLVYHEITAWTASPNARVEEAPILSDDGRRIAFTRSPGTQDPQDPNRIFIMDADGAHEREIDSYVPLCSCGSMIDLSADGGRVVASDSVQLRVADAAGSAGRLLLALASNELNAVRISGDGGTIVFRVYRDTTFRDSAEPITRGVYAIDPSGANLRLLAGPDTIAAAFGVPVEQVPGVGASAGVDLSHDGSRVVAAVFVAPVPGGSGQAVVVIDGEAAARALVAPVPFIQNLALSADGATVAYVAVNEANAAVTAVVAADGGEPRALVASSAEPPGINQPLTTSGERIQLTADGTRLLLGGTGLLIDTANGHLLALSVADGSSLTGPAPLVDGTLDLATMDAAGGRIAYLSPDPAGVLQLAMLEIDPAGAGNAPALESLTVEPDAIGLNQSGAATVTVAVAHDGGDLRVGLAVLRDGRADPNVAGPVLLSDDGTTLGDRAAGDGVYTNETVTANCCAVPGPRMIRVKAEAVGADGRRVAAALQGGDLAVTG